MITIWLVMIFIPAEFLSLSPNKAIGALIYRSLGLFIFGGIIQVYKSRLYPEAGLFQGLIPTLSLLNPFRWYRIIHHVFSFQRKLCHLATKHKQLLESTEKEKLGDLVQTTIQAAIEYVYVLMKGVTACPNSIHIKIIDPSNDTLSTTFRSKSCQERHYDEIFTLAPKTQLKEISIKKSTNLIQMLAEEQHFSPFKINSAYWHLHRSKDASWIGNNLPKKRKLNLYYSDSDFNESYNSKAVFRLSNRSLQENEESCLRELFNKFSNTPAKDHKPNIVGYLSCDSTSTICYNHKTTKVIGEYVANRLYYFLRSIDKDLSETLKQRAEQLRSPV